jgi:hypothetical protein
MATLHILSLAEARRPVAKPPPHYERQAANLRSRHVAAQSYGRFPFSVRQ